MKMENKFIVELTADEAILLNLIMKDYVKGAEKANPNIPFEQGNQGYSLALFLRNFTEKSVRTEVKV